MLCSCWVVCGAFHVILLWKHCYWSFLFNLHIVSILDACASAHYWCLKRVLGWHEKVISLGVEKQDVSRSGWQPRWGYGKMLIVVADRDRNSKMNRWTRLWPLIARVRRQVDCVQRSNKGILFEWWVKVAYLNVHLILSRACDSEIQIKVWHLDNVPVSPLYPWKSNASYLPPKKAFASEISNMEDSPVWGW